MSTRSKLGRSCLVLVLTAAIFQPATAGGYTLSENRDRLFRAWAARNRPGTDVCEAYRDLTNHEEGVFLAVTHRLSLGVLNQPSGWSLAQLGYTPCLKEGRNDPSLPGGPTCTLLDHIDDLYAILGQQPGEGCGTGGDGNRLFMSMDYDMWKAANLYPGTSILSQVWRFFKWVFHGFSYRNRPQNSPIFIYGDQYTGTQDPFGPHDPFNASIEARAGSPRAQLHFWSITNSYHECPPGESPTVCFDGTCIDPIEIDPYCVPTEPWCGCQSLVSTGKYYTVTRPPFAPVNIADEFFLEMDQDYDNQFPFNFHPSGTECEYSGGTGREIYESNFGRQNPVEWNWVPNGCAPPTPTPGGDGTNVVFLQGRHQQVWPPAALPQLGPDLVPLTPVFDGNSRLTDANARNAVRDTIAAACTLPETCVVVCYSAGCARALLAFSDLEGAGTPPDGLLWIEAGASSAGGTELVSGFSGFISWLLGKKQPIDDDISVSAMRGTFGFMQNSAPVPMFHDAGDENICVRFLFVKVCGNGNFPGGKGDGAVPLHSACGYASAGAYSDCCGGGKYTNRVSDVCLHSADHYEMQAVAANRAVERLAIGGGVPPERFPDSGDVPDCSPATPDACECNPINWIDTCSLYGGSCTSEDIMQIGCGPAACGDGVCAGGEDGAGCPIDCCDSATPCGQSKLNQGREYCRADGSFTYRWMTNADISLLCDEPGETCVSTISCTGQTLHCKGGNLWSTSGCGGSDGICTEGETPESNPADCQSCGGAGGNTCEGIISLCAGYPLLENAECPVCCTRELPSCGAAGGNTCEATPSLCLGRQWLPSVDCPVCCRVPVCGNSTCEGPDENCATCPGDCPCPVGASCDPDFGFCSGGTVPAVCPNGSCEVTENCDTCPDDCAMGAFCTCGDGVCDAGENCVSCSADCGCAGGATCDTTWGVCVAGSCPPDCGPPSCGAAGGNTCGAPGSSVCDGRPLLASYDCAICCFIPPPVCGNLSCDPGETAWGCPSDCGCGAPFACLDQAPAGCWCDAACVEAGDCCPDACAECGACQPGCPDGSCAGGENCYSCPDDCGSCSSTCAAAGGNTCGAVGSSACDGYPLLASSNCGVCCNVPAPVCSDGACNGGETCDSCPDDCGPCLGSCGAVGGNTCGGPSGSSPCDGYPLLPSSDCATCCYIPAVGCGDGLCQGSESCTSCPDDCGVCPPGCPNGSCDGGEDCASCPDDCGSCYPSCGAAGGNTCGGAPGSSPCDGYPLLPSSDCQTCCYIPVAACGDGACDGGEDVSSCPADCGCAAPGACGAQAPAGCWCDAICVTSGDCCPDACSECGHCPLPSCGAAGGNTCGGPSGSSRCDGHPLLPSSDCETCCDLPSCGGAGGNTCAAAGSHTCDGYAQYDTYDCEVCCYIPVPVCGDGVCDAGGGETDFDCAEDCGCAAPDPTPPDPDFPPPDSCGTQAPYGCWCDTLCVGAGDCCSDACLVCGAC